MNSAAWAGVAAEQAAEEKAAKQAEAPAGVRATADAPGRAAVGSLNKLTNQPFYHLTKTKGGEQYATGR